MNLWCTSGRFFKRHRRLEADRLHRQYRTWNERQKSLCRVARDESANSRSPDGSHDEQFDVVVFNAVPNREIRRSGREVNTGGFRKFKLFQLSRNVLLCVSPVLGRRFSGNTRCWQASNRILGIPPHAAHEVPRCAVGPSSNPVPSPSRQRVEGRGPLRSKRSCDQAVGLATQTAQGHFRSSLIAVLPAINGIPGFVSLAPTITRS